MYRMFFNFLRIFNDNIPSRMEIRYHFSQSNKFKRHNLVRKSAILYANGWSLEEISKRYVTTRERIRQCILVYPFRAYQ